MTESEKERSLITQNEIMLTANEAAYFFLQQEESSARRAVTVVGETCH